MQQQDRSLGLFQCPGEPAERNTLLKWALGIPGVRGTYFLVCRQDLQHGMTAAEVAETLLLLVAREMWGPGGWHRAQSSDDSPQACLWDVRGQGVAAPSENGCTMALEMHLKRDFPCSRCSVVFDTTPCLYPSCQ